MTETMQSYGKVQTVVNGDVIQDKEYGLKYDGMNMDIAVKDAVNKKLTLGKLGKNDILNLLSNKNEKKCLKENLESLLPKKIYERKKSKTKKKRKKKKKKNITFKIEEMPNKRKKKSRRKRTKNKKEQKLNAFFNFLN
ncbi:MAG: hypothetical protein H8E55_10770 [Pelagibacterales bacterium]|nr:hypothetical protein [Pelagibacterales bacterium]